MKEQQKVLVLGAGLVGLPIARDLALAQEFDVSISDHDGQRLETAASFGLKTLKADLLHASDEELSG
ncbi:MAG: hypothetical protein K8F24_11145, partial [Bacteroidales bacterium]|nr:hypothetical protein [Bacteroidales bacterium]